MSSPDRESTEAEGPLVLIVDDNAMNAKLVADVLTAAGFRTLAAATGEEGVALADEHLPDVILMDIRLPDIDGADAAALLNRRTRTASIPVVALTSLNLEGDPAWLTTAGFALRQWWTDTGGRFGLSLAEAI
jgi:two-component system cell cycle response regulator DivK